jgi:histidine ammonia-lyase
MGATGALKLRQVADNLANILAIELMCAAQGIDFRKRRGYEKSRLGKRTAPVYTSIRKEVPFIEHDEYLKDHIDHVRGIVDRFGNE